MFASANSYSRQAEKIMAEVKKREGVNLWKKCDALVRLKKDEEDKSVKRMEKDLSLSKIRQGTGNVNGAVLGVKAVKRAELHLAKVRAVIAYLEGVQMQVSTVLKEGRDKPHQMEIPTTIEKVKEQIKKIEKEHDVISSSSTLSTEDLMKEFNLDRRSVYKVN